MNYKIIKNEERFRSFIEWLPELEEGEQFYVCLFARKKYDSSGTIKRDKGQLKRFVSNKQYLYQKVRQLECEIGCYQNFGEPVPKECLALYIMPNPRSFKLAMKKSLCEFAQLIAKEDWFRNPHSLAMSNIHKSCSRKIFLDFDFDDKVFVPSDIDFLNKDCVTVLVTRGGCHILVELSKIENRYKNSWYNKMTSLGCDVKGDNLIPVPGCVQGGFEPYLKG